MNNILETFELYTSHDNNYVCRIDPMLFLMSIMVFIIIIYIIQFKVK
jgi:hypothetical protein